MILLVGPILPPITGQSLAFTRVYESFDVKEVDLINTNLEKQGKFKKILNTFLIIYKIVMKIIFNNYTKVYFTCSRSFSGSLKDIILIQIASLKNIRIINHLHGSDFYDFLHSSTGFYKKILLNSYKKVDTSIVLLDSMKNQFVDFPNMNIEIIPNFYDKELEKNDIEKDINKINLLYLSNIMKSKGIFELIDAIIELNIKYSREITFTIAGDILGDKYLSEEETRKLFDQKIYNQNIKYVGRVFGEKKILLFQKSDIFILPSYKEAFPISILEAMACKNAIITSNCDYLPEILNSSNGILITPKSVIEIENAIEILINNKILLKKIQENNSQEAKEKYSLEKYISNIKRVLK